MAPKKHKKTAKKPPLPPKIPENFVGLVNDFVKDLSVTFPEFTHLWEKWSNPEMSDEEQRHLFDYCLTVFPSRFFDILYQNDDIFKADSEFNTFFLPGVDFKLLYNCENVSETTRKAIWKYLQVLLLSSINSIKDKTNFGDTMNIFDGVDEEELQNKLSETLSGISDFFKDNEGFHEGEEGKGEQDEGEQGEESARPKFNFENMNIPNAEDLHGHLKGLFDGKIGSLAKEMAAEIASEFSDVLGDESDESRSAGDVLKNIMKNPKKIMEMMKTVGSKLKTKMNSGDISQEELMKEASEWISKMKDMGEEGELGEMLKNLTRQMGGLGGLGDLAGLAGLGKNMKIDTNALDRMTKQQKMKERMRAKLEKRRAEAQAQAAKNNLMATETPNNFVFRTGDGPQEKSVRPQKIEMDVDALVKEIEGDSPEPIVSKSSKKKKNKK
jgi:hypothetical protein